MTQKGICVSSIFSSTKKRVRRSVNRYIGRDIENEREIVVLPAEKGI